MTGISKSCQIITRLFFRPIIMKSDSICQKRSSEDVNGKTEFLPYFCIIHEGNSSLSGNTRGPSIKDVSNFFLVFDTHAFSTWVFYSYPLAILANLLTPPPTSNVCYGWSLERMGPFCGPDGFKRIHYFCKK